MEPVSLPVIHPAFSRLQRNGRFLHLIAALLILGHALAHLRNNHPDPFYFSCLLIIGLDILILVFALRQALSDWPLVNLIFRMIEWIFFLGIGLFALSRHDWIIAAFHLLLALAYLFLFYCERQIGREEFLSIQHTGIRVPDLPGSKFLQWSGITRVEADYHSIRIFSVRRKRYQFPLRQKMEFEELDQIHEFCRHYLGDV